MKKINWVRGWIYRDAIFYQGNYDRWEDALLNSTGYDASEILEKVLSSTLKIKRGDVVYERDSVIFDNIEYSWMLVSGLMLAASNNEGRLNVLDFGGSLGSSYFQNREFLSLLKNVRWNVVEQQHFVEAGQNEIQDNVLRFYKNIEECLLENQPNVILFSSVLQYLQVPLSVIDQMSMANAKFLIIDRTPFSSRSSDSLLIQQVPEYIYKASYPMWVFSEETFIAHLGNKWRLIASEDSRDGTVMCDDGFEFTFRGMIFGAR